MTTRKRSSKTTLPLLVVFVFTAVFGTTALFGFPGVASAQIPVTDAANLAPNTATAAGVGISTSDQLKTSTWQLIKKAFVNTAALAILNAGHYFLQKLAYDAANYIASGGSGQKPFFTTKGLGDHLRSTALDAAGEALGTISQESGLEALGINLCNPTSPRVALNIKLGFLNGLPGLLGGPISPGQPRPRCEWNQIEANWEEFSNLDSDTVLSQVGVMFTPGQSSLGAALEFNRYSFDLINKKQEQAIDKFLADKGFQDLKSKISGRVLTPADTIREEMNRVNKQAAEEGRRQTDIYTASAIQEGAFGLLPAALQTFVNTLGEKLMKRIFEKGLIALSQVDGPDDPFNFDAGTSGGGRVAAELANANLLTPRIFTSTDLDELTEFATCPPEGRGLNNCVMDQQMFNGVQRSSQGAAVTVSQAIRQGFLRGNWRLLPQGHPRNADRNCYREAYCHSNLVKMRRARIIPIGWELAANSPFNDVTNPVTLQEVVDRFNDCPVDAAGNLDESKLPDPLHPWCRLIDPNWVLKYPEAICRQEAPGPLLLNAAGNVRGRACVDSTSCILQDADGKCIGGYGYCVQEKTFWKLDGDACPAQYASCQTVRRADGRNFSYLMNTTQVSVCNADNAGCREYSRVMNAVANAGFEDLLSGGPRSWSGASGVDATGAAALRGRNALVLNSGATATQNVRSLLPGTEYALSASAVARDTGSSGGIARVTVSFRDRFGASVPDTAAGDPGLASDCALNAAETTATFEVVMTDLGYTAAGCKVTSPARAASAVVTVQAVGGNAFVDEVGMVGASYSADPLDSVFLNAKAETCPADQAGCTELVRASTGTLNLVRNPGFETPAPGGTAPSFWTVPAGAYEASLFNGSEGASSVILGPSPVVQEVKNLIPNATYTFSVFTKHDGTGSPPSGLATLSLLTTGGSPVPAAPASTSPIPATTCTRSGNSLLLDLATGTEYQRSECQFTTPPDIGAVRVALTSSSAAARLLADAVQLELSVRATGYHEGHAPGAQRVTLKLPPKGLNCAGTPADPSACSAFAPSCRKDDVGCNLYTPVGGGTGIPAVTTASDACPAACSGYDAFRQEPTNFASSAFPLFLIPSTGQSCTASEAGCEEFTNLSTLARGGEAREYFTRIRLCTPPDAQTDTFYTWEGSDVEGFQLRVWRLRRSNATSPATGAFGSDPTGGVGPCTNLEYDAQGNPRCADDLAAGNIASCDRTMMLFNPDCREFYDTAGNIHYRFYSRTVVASDACTTYRMTRSEQSDCRTHGGLWTGTECHYFGLAAESRACRPQAAGCRAYTGNAARNVRIVMSDAFESGTTENWTRDADGGATPDVTNSNESVTAGGHSLRSSAPTVQKNVSSLIRRGRSYLLTFWAKGNGDLSVAFSDAGDTPFTFNRLTNADAPVLLTTEWNVYTLGPVDVTDAPGAAEQLVFSFQGPGAPLYFLDNIELREVAESVYLIKDSWNTPAICDQTPDGQVAPRYMLGCRSYTDKDRTTVHLKSFSRLCSESAVGCEAFYHTQNSVSPFGQTFNAICRLASSCVPSGGVTCGCQVDGATVCQVAQGDTECRYDAEHAVEPVLSASGGHVSPLGDTAVVPDDAIVYVINDARFRCSADNIGCSAVGLRTLNQDGDVIEAWETKHLKDLPDRYRDILCTERENFCQAYVRSVDNLPVHFKDPGNHTCEYREGVLIGGFTYSGWFKKGLNEPCYQNFLEAGTSYGIWKNSDALYEGWVGECPGQFDQCKEFIDPLDTSEAHPRGQPYYAILNDRLDTRSCQNQVSLITAPRSASDASACVLFDRTDDLVKRFSATESYARSDAENGALVGAVSAASNDANVVIRVQRDRRCGQWLDCRSSETVFNSSTGAFQNVCTAFGICDRFEKVGDVVRCVNFTEHDFSGQVIDLAAYQARDVGRGSGEYSGYAVPNRYPVNELVTLDIAPNAGSPDLRLVYVGGVCASGVAYGTPCGPANNRGNRGSCLGHTTPRLCVYPVDGSSGLGPNSNLNLDVWANRYPQTSCRAYPQETSPYPSKVADPSGWDASAAHLNNGNPVLIGPAPAFSGANVCQRRIDPATGREFSSCECSYQIAEYGRRTATRYFSINDSDLPSGYCQGGAFEGYECDPRASGRRSEANLSCCSTVVSDDLLGTSGCADGAICQPLSKIDRVVGYEGQCLERDLAIPINNSFSEFACVTWRPVGIVGGTRDIYNLNQTAGYFAQPDKKFYCAGVQGEWVHRIEIDPSRPLAEQPVTKFFGPGKVSANIDGYMSRGGNCSHHADDIGGTVFCLFPGASEPVAHGPIFDGDTQRSCSIATRCNEQQGCVVTGSGCGGTNTCLVPFDKTDGTCFQRVGFGLRGDATSVLGCYEVSDSPKSTPPATIEWPYIGPPVNRLQLKHMYFQVTDDIYHYDPERSESEGVAYNTTRVAKGRGSDPGASYGPDSGIRVTGIDRKSYTSNTPIHKFIIPRTDGKNEPAFHRIPTNPGQDIFADCNDDGDDNIDFEGDDERDSERKTDLTHLIDSTKRTDGVFKLSQETNWGVDASDHEGVIALSAHFDNNGWLKSVKLATRDNSDEGTFGIFEMGFVFKEGCSAIAQVDEPGEFGLTKAFTEYVNIHAEYAGAGVGAYEYSDACRPYAAIGGTALAPDSLSPSNPWGFVTAMRQGADDARAPLAPNLQCNSEGYYFGGAYVNNPAETNFFNNLRGLFRKIYRVWNFLGHLPDAASELRNAIGGSVGRFGVGTLYAELPGPPSSAPSATIYDETGRVIVLGITTGAQGQLLGTPYVFPKVASVSNENCDQNGRCPAGRVGAISVNGRDAGIVSAQNGVLTAIAKFYGWAHHNAMPILSRTMIWGDFVPAEPPGKGWYKNHKPYCSAGTSPDPSSAAGECTSAAFTGANTGLTCVADTDCPGVQTCVTDAPNHFGNTPGACEARPFEFQHVYTCSLKDLQAIGGNVCDTPDGTPATNAPCRRLLDPDGPGPLAGSHVCVYRPAVQVKDNWGWCNCTGPDCIIPGGVHEGPDGRGCDISDPANDDALPWTWFDGEIRVFPRPEDAAAFVPPPSGGTGGCVTKIFGICLHQLQFVNPQTFPSFFN